MDTDFDVLEVDCPARTAFDARPAPEGPPTPIARAAA
jgi:hypothetical protein